MDGRGRRGHTSEVQADSSAMSSASQALIYDPHHGPVWAQVSAQSRLTVGSTVPALWVTVAPQCQL